MRYTSLYLLHKPLLTMLLSALLTGCVTQQGFQLPDFALSHLLNGDASDQASEKAPVPAHTVADIGVTDCDRLATSGTDPDRVPGAPPVTREKLDAVSVIAACKQALSEHPEHRRLHALLARGYLKVGLYDEAYAVASPAAENGSLYAMYLMGVLYETRSNKEKALQTYEYAAKAGQIDAMVHLAWMLFRRDSWGDRGKAQSWMQKAAESGTPTGQRGLANLYLELESKDNIAPASAFKKAYPWYRRAAAQGDAQALFILGRYSANGFSPVSINPAQALAYFDRAAAAGNQGASVEAAKLYLLDRDAGGALTPDSPEQRSEQAVHWLIHDMPQLSGRKADSI